MDQSLTLQEIADLLGIGKRAAGLRAHAGQWPFIHAEARGGKQRRYPLAGLPADVRRAWVEQAARAEAASLPAPGEKALAKPKAAAKALLPAGLERDIDRTEAQARAGLVMALRDGAALEGISKSAAARRLAAEIAAGAAPPPLLALAAQASARQRGGGEAVSARSLLRWAALLEQGEQAGEALRFLLPARRLPEDWHAAPWAAALLARYRLPQNPDLALAVRQTRADLKARGWDAAAIPSYHQALRWLEKLPVRVRERGRASGAALKELLPHIRRDWSFLNANDVWVGDGHTFKAKVCHPSHGQPFAPEVTVVIDAGSRMIVGWAVSLAENCVAVAEAIGKGMAAYGKPLIYYSDNGAGQTAKFLDHEITGILARFGVRHETGIPGNPQGRGIIERLWMTALFPLAKAYPTYQGKDMDHVALQKVTRDINSAKRFGAAPAYVPAWAQFVADVEAAVKAYNFEHKHRELGGLAPAEAYAERLGRDSVLPLTDAEKAEVFRPEALRTVQRGEIALFNNRYASPALEDWNGRQVRVLFDFADAQEVWVRDIAGRQICAAKFNANLRDGFDKSLLEQLRDERVNAAVDALQEKIRVKRLEASATLDAEATHALNAQWLEAGEWIVAEEAKAAPRRDRDAELLEAGARLLAEEAARPKPRRDADADLLEQGRRIVEAEAGRKAPEAAKAEPAETAPPRSAEVAEVIALKPGRPRFLDDVSMLEWLSSHREEIGPPDIEWMRACLAQSAQFKRAFAEVFADESPLKKKAAS
jgi:putative transposase